MKHTENKYKEIKNIYIYTHTFMIRSSFQTGMRVVTRGYIYIYTVIIANVDTYDNRNTKIVLWNGHQGGKEVFYLTTHSTHFIYDYMASDIW